MDYLGFHYFFKKSYNEHEEDKTLRIKCFDFQQPSSIITFSEFRKACSLKKLVSSFQRSVSNQAQQVREHFDVPALNWLVT